MDTLPDTQSAEMCAEHVEHFCDDCRSCTSLWQGPQGLDLLADTRSLRGSFVPGLRSFLLRLRGWLLKDAGGCVSVCVCIYIYIYMCVCVCVTIWPETATPVLKR